MFMRMVYDEKLAQAAYVIGCERTGEAIVVDPERDVDRYVELARAHGLRIVAVAETHIHADFVSGARELAHHHGAHVYVSGEGGADWQSKWAGDYPHTLLRDGDKFSIGAIDFEVVHTPGHTPEHVCYLVTDRGGGATEPIGMLTGDFVFVGDLGRPDLLETAAGQAGAMKPSARTLFKSVRGLARVPDYVQVWPAHGAGSACGKALGAVPTSTMGYERRFNPAIRAAENEDGFVDFILAGQPEPPLYFANMKRDNRDGPRLLSGGHGGVPAPARLSVEELRALAGGPARIIDTRPWAAFRDGHVPGSLSIPLTNSFGGDAGAFVRDTEDVVLIVEPGQVDRAVRELVRVGLDRVAGWFDASELERYDDAGHGLGRVPEISAQEAGELIDAGGATVLDVRRATEFAEGHVPGALNIAHTRLASRLDEVPSSKRLLVYCHSGARSARSCSFLRAEGFDAVNMAGGILAWRQSRETIGN